MQILSYLPKALKINEQSIKILDKILGKKEQRQNLLEDNKHIYYWNSLQVKLGDVQKFRK